MGDIIQVIDGFRRLLQDCGSAAEPFIDIDKFWEDEEVLNQRRLSLVQHIHQTYLPGYQFSSNEHFRWHFYERDDPFLILRGRAPNRYFEHWLRAIMVPSARHYHAEIAAAMKAGEDKYKSRLQHNSRWDEEMKWPNRVQRVLNMGGVRGADPTVTEADKRTIFRWAHDAPELRRVRLHKKPPSAWQIMEIMLEGDDEKRYGTPIDHIVGSDDSDCAPLYRETWVWPKESGLPAPDCDSWTFTSPAAFTLWQKPWLNKPARPQG